MFNIPIVQLFDSISHIVQAEKAAFEEAEKKREEEVWAYWFFCFHFCLHIDGFLFTFLSHNL